MPEGSYITKKGINLVGKILATQSTLQITGAKVGDGDLPAGSTPADMEALSSYVMDATVQGITNPENGEVVVTLQLLSADVAAAFFVREVAIMAQDPDEGEILYCYIPMQDDPIQMRGAGSGVGKMLTLDIGIIVAGVASVQAVIDPSGLLRRGDINVPGGVAGLDERGEIRPPQRVIRDDNGSGDGYLLGVEDGKLYIMEV